MSPPAGTGKESKHRAVPPGGALSMLKLRGLYYDYGFVYVEIDNSGEVYIRPRLMPLKYVVPKEYVCLAAN
jgi:hypothetical protein